MNRARALIFVLGGVALLATRLISPADSSPRVPAATPMPEPRDEQDATLDSMRAEVDRLRERTRRDPAVPSPSRDPFSFGRRPEPARAVEPALPAASVPVEPAVVLPGLVAVLVDNGPNGAVRTAVFSLGESVDLIGAGESIGGFRVDTISADGVAIVHRDSGARYSLSLN